MFHWASFGPAARYSPWGLQEEATSFAVLSHCGHVIRTAAVKRDADREGEKERESSFLRVT